MLGAALWLPTAPLPAALALVMSQMQRTKYIWHLASVQLSLFKKQHVFVSVWNLFLF